MKIYKYKFLNIRTLVIVYWCLILPFYGIGQPLCNNDTESCISISLVQIGGGSITPTPGYEDVGEVVLPCGYDNIYIAAQWEGNPDIDLDTWTFSFNNGTIAGDGYACMRGCPSGVDAMDTVMISVDIDSLTTCECLMILQESIIPAASDKHLKLCEEDDDGIVQYDPNDIEQDSITIDDAVTISYHLSEATANDGTVPITDSIGISDAYTLYARVASEVALGCFSVAEVSFEIQQNPTISLIADFPVLTCDMDSVTLRATVESEEPPPYVYNWLPNMDENLMGVKQDTLVVTTTGLHNVVVNSGGCFGHTQIEVNGNFIAPEFDSTAISALGGTVVDCQQSPLTLLAHATSPNGDTLLYEWTTADGNISTNLSQDSIMITSAGTYTVTVTQAETGCTISESIVMTSAADTLGLMVTPTTAALTCGEPTITLTASLSSNGVFSYIWNTGDTEASLNVDAPDTYSVTITDNMTGCSTDLEVVVVEELDTPTVNNTALNSCDTSVGTAIFDLTNTSVTSENNVAITYYTNMADAETGSNVIADPVMYSSGEGLVFARVEYQETGCFSIAEIDLSLNELEIPAIHFSPKVSELCQFDQVATVSVTNPMPDHTYTWSMNGTDPTNVMTIENCAALELPLGITLLSLEIQFGDCISVEEYPVVRELQGTPQTEILRLGPANILFCNRNDYISYQWGRERKTDFCPEPIDGAIYQDYIVENIDTENYYYWLIVENESGCKEKIYYLENPFQRLAETPTTYISEFTMQVAPNPTNGIFNIEMIGSEVLALDLHIYDVLGREFFYQHIDKLNTIERISLSFPTLPEGLYFIQITDNHDIHLVEKVINE